VCGEARIFPLLQLGAVLSPHVQAVTAHFRGAGYDVDQVEVLYEFQRGGNQMLKITKAGQADSLGSIVREDLS